MIKTNTSKSKTYELSEQNSVEKSDLNFPADLGSQALLLQEFNEETESRHHDFYVFTMTLSLRITSNDFPTLSIFSSMKSPEGGPPIFRLNSYDKG